MNDANFPQLRLAKKHLHSLVAASANLAYKCEINETPPPKSANLGYVLRDDDRSKICVEIGSRFANYLNAPKVTDQDKVELLTEKLRAGIAGSQRPVLIS